MRTFKFDPRAVWPVVRCIFTGPRGALNLRLVLDSGAQTTQLSRGAIKHLGFLNRKSLREVYAVGVGGAKEVGVEVRIPRLFLLGKRFENIPIAVFEMGYLSDSEVDGLVGWDIIRQLCFTLNGPAGTLLVI